jgi:regulator of nonsense transcripts 1
MVLFSVHTEEFIKRFAHQKFNYLLHTLEGYQWEELGNDAQLFKAAFTGSRDSVKVRLRTCEFEDLDKLMQFGRSYHADDRMFWIFDVAIERAPFDMALVEAWMEDEPTLVFSLLKRHPPTGECLLHAELLSNSQACYCIIRNIIRSANVVGIACLVALEKIRISIANLELPVYLELLELAALSVRSIETVQEMLLVLHECRGSSGEVSPSMNHAHKHALAICFDRVEEDADECPCDSDGNPTKQRSAPIQRYIEANGRAAIAY